MRKVILLFLCVPFLLITLGCEEVTKYKTKLDIKKMDSSFYIKVLDIEKNDEHKPPNVTILYEMHNVSGAHIKAFKGMLILKDVYGEIIKEERRDNEEGLKAGWYYEKIKLYIPNYEGIRFLETVRNMYEYRKAQALDMQKKNFSLKYVPEIIVYESGKILKREELTKAME